MADKDNASDANKNTKFKPILIGSTVVVGVVIAMAVISHHGQKKALGQTKAPNAPKHVTNTPGRGSKRYKKMMHKLDNKRSRNAIRHGKSYVPIPVFNGHGHSAAQATTKPSGHHASNHAPASASGPSGHPPQAGGATGAISSPSNPSGASNAAAREAERAQKQAHQQKLHEIEHEMTALASSWSNIGQPKSYATHNSQPGSHHGGGTHSGQPSSPTHTNSGTGHSSAHKGGGGQPPVKGLKAGSILYGVEDVAINSKVKAPARATVLQGRFRGAVLLGSFSRKGDTLRVQFNKLIAKNGTAYSIRAYAISPKTTSADVATAVNNHDFTKWLGLAAARFVQGLGRAAQLAGSTIVQSAGAGGTSSFTSHRQFSFGKQAEIAGGKVGESLGNQVQQHLMNEPPTVKMRKGQPIGILIVSAKKG